MSTPHTRPIALRRISTVEALVDAIREQVLSGALPGGAPLREADLCATFGVSRHTVRTSLLALSHEGIVRIEPNRGATVPALTAADVDDLFDLRIVLESACARVVARDADRLGPVQAAVRQLEGIPAKASWERVRDADLAFHQALVDAAGSPRTSQTFRALLSELRLGFVQLRAELEDHAVVARQHAQILAKLKKGDADRAVAALVKHLDAARRDILAAYSEQAAAAH